MHQCLDQTYCVMLLYILNKKDPYNPLTGLQMQNLYLLVSYENRYDRCSLRMSDLKIKLDIKRFI